MTALTSRPTAIAAFLSFLCTGGLTAQDEWLRTVRPGSAYPTAIAHDSNRKRIVVVQRCGSTMEVFEWDGQSWHHPRPPQAPPPRDGGMLAFDSKRGRTVLFGGTWWTSNERNDVWEWDGRRWHQGLPPTAPAPRVDAAITFHAGLGEVVVQGGQGRDSAGQPVVLRRDTWSWNGVRWLRLDDGNGLLTPGPRALHAMVHDLATGELILFGGYLGNGAYANDTWAWRPGSGWLPLLTAGAPSARAWHQMAFDPVRGVGILFGQYLQWDNHETWEWDGPARTWTLVSATPPGGIRRQQPGLVHDGQHVLLFGGVANYSLGPSSAEAGVRSDLHAWDPGAGTWMELQGSLPPRGRWIMAGDSVRGALVAFSADELTNVAWERKGTWRAIPMVTAPRPSRRWNPGLADTHRGSVLLFGGDSASVLQGDTWRFDGTSWTSLGGGPSPRTEVAMTGTPWNGGTVLLFGGLTGSNRDVVSDELWSHDGTTWSAVPKTGPWPPPLRGAALAYDAARGRVVLFGGRRASGAETAATWEWDGQAWHAMSPSSPPPPMSGHRMTFDPGTGTCLALRWNGDAWRWDGADWTPVVVCEPLGVRNAAGLGVDPSTGEVVVLGGDGGHDEWTLSTSDRARFETFGVGCPEGDEPALSASGDPVLGTTFDVDVAWGGLDTAVYFLGVSRSLFGGAQLPLDLSTIGLAGCWLQVSIDANVPATQVGAPTGTARLSIPIPNDASLIGACVFTQTLVMRGPQAGLSDAALLRFGR